MQLIPHRSIGHLGSGFGSDLFFFLFGFISGHRRCVYFILRMPKLSTIPYSMTLIIAHRDSMHHTQATKNIVRLVKRFQELMIELN